VCPLFLLTGEYDYSCTPDDTRALARQIPGAQVTIMEGLGHFPVSEDPQRFLACLRPVLAAILEGAPALPLREQAERETPNSGN
jgi:pimeloyl-ACP methyl ester carboxylesterase